jgi:hypothetical protein
VGSSFPSEPDTFEKEMLPALSGKFENNNSPSAGLKALCMFNPEINTD